MPSPMSRKSESTTAFSAFTNRLWHCTTISSLAVVVVVVVVIVVVVVVALSTCVVVCVVTIFHVLAVLSSKGMTYWK
jgi:hypothetical protein